MTPADLAPIPGASTSERPFLAIRPSSGWVALELKELWEFRDLLFTLAGRDLKLRYKQTALGVVWVVLQPLMAAGIFSFVFGKVAKMPSDGVPYFLFSYAGLLGWNLFNNTITKVSGCLTGNSQLISKVYFPRLILPLSSVPSAMVDFTIALAMLAVLMAINQFAPPLSILLLPLWMLFLVMLAMGVGLLTSSLSVTYRDVAYILPVALQILLYGSPIAYAVSAVPENLRTVYYLNPLSAPLEAFRACLLGTAMPSWQALAYTGIMATVLLVAGVFAFKRMEKTFADVI